MKYLEVFKLVLFAGVQIAALAIWVDRYIEFRLKQKLNSNPPPDHRSWHFQLLALPIFVLMNMITLTSYIHNSNWFLSVEPNDWIRFLGVLVIAASGALYKWAARSRMISHFHGPYGYVRHPIYFAMILMGLGLCLASGSIWVFMMTIYGAAEIIQTLKSEEEYQRTHFANYETYQVSTKRLIPFVF